MPDPTGTLATLRPELGGSLEEFGYVADRAGFIGLQVFPVFEAGEAAGTFGRIPLAELLRGASTRRAPGAQYPRGEWKFDTSTYACEEHGWEEPVDDREARAYRNYFDSELVSANRSRDIILRNHESRIATAIEGSGNTTGVTTPWTTWATATPVADVEGAVQAVWSRTGIWPNALTVSRQTFRQLRNTQEVIDRVASAGAGDQARASDITAAQLANVFDLDFVLVGGGAKNTADKGVAASIAGVWDKDKAIVTRVALTNDLREPCVGRTFHWAVDGSMIGATMESYRDESRRSNIIRARMDTDEVTMMGGLIQVLTGVNP